MKPSGQQPRDASVDVVGRSINRWCNEVDISRATYYRLAPPEKPLTAKVRGRVIVREAPRAWLDRLAARQESAA